MTAVKEDSLSEQPFVSHLLELRDRLIRMLLVVLIVFIALFPFGNDIYTFIADPLMAVLPEGTSMIATQVASPFLTPFKLSLMAAVFLSMPYILYQFWGFIAPGLYQHEKRLATPLLISSILLFYLGMSFAYFVVFPLVFGFLTGVAPEGVAVMTDITNYLDFVLTLFFAFGFAFEVPIATILLVWMRITTPDKLASKRPYIIVGAFVIGMFLTPPDVISQTLLAFPMWLLFELGVIFSRMFVPKQEDEGEEDEAAEASAKSSTVATASSHYPDDYEPLSDDDMESELDRMDALEWSDEWDDDWSQEETEAEQAPATDAEPDKNPVDLKLERVQALRDAMKLDAARLLLYEVLAEGDESQINVARNVLAQLDEEV